MIPIAIKNRSIITNYANSVISFIENNTDRKIANLNDIENAINDLSSGFFTFFDLLQMNFDELRTKVKPLYISYKKQIPQTIISQLDQLKRIPWKKKTQSQKELQKHLKNITFESFIDYYKNFFNRYGLTFMNDIGIKVCPYCNRNYIYNASSSRTSEFDHFIPKEEFPIFALCFYNLIPSCKVCNHIKSDKLLSYLINPYDKNLNNNSFIFDAKPTGYGQFNLELKASTSNLKKAEDTLNNDLQLKELYKYHSYLAEEIYQKSLMLNDSYLSSLRKDFFDNFPHYIDGDFRRFILGNYGDDSDYSQRTLSKATHDCAVQFKLLQKI
ncbi:hypothetical protein [uncultured Treponema sp.]|uniref:HNH endonuclease n=1 Tax=uncultured Treponema sp. TaxID=162155 RepID=UPI0025936BD4|nr:hypothetical protein [uncultured Treponema sp.]